jgi:hypothetical protein
MHFVLSQCLLQSFLTGFLGIVTLALHQCQLCPSHSSASVTLGSLE